MKVWYVGEDMTETATGLTAGGSALNSATITYALLDSAGVAVEVDDTPVTGSYTYTPASSGDYTAAIESTVTEVLTPGSLYLLDVTGSQGGYNFRRRLERRAMYRGDD